MDDDGGAIGGGATEPVVRSVDRSRVVIGYTRDSGNYGCGWLLVAVSVGFAVFWGGFLVGLMWW